MDGDLAVQGSLTLGGKKVYSSPELLFRHDHPASVTQGDHTFAAGTPARGATSPI